MCVGYRWLPVCVSVTELLSQPRDVCRKIQHIRVEPPVSRTYTASSLRPRFSQAENKIEQSLPRIPIQITENLVSTSTYEVTERRLGLAIKLAIYTKNLQTIPTGVSALRYAIHFASSFFAILRPMTTGCASLC